MNNFDIEQAAVEILRDHKKDPDTPREVGNSLDAAIRYLEQELLKRVTTNE